MTLTRYTAQATQVAEIVTHVMSNELRLMPPVNFGVTERGGLAWLVIGMDMMGLGKNADVYRSPRITSHLSAVLSAATKREIPVCVSRPMTPVQYGVLLSGRPKLPWLVPFPGIRSGDLRIGQARRGEASISWQALNRQGHVMVAGMTGSGKSTLLRSIVHQAIAEGDTCRLSDMDARTFPALREHPQLDMPIATTDAGIEMMVQRTLAECEIRSRHYDAVGDNPDDLDEYNAAATTAGLQTLPRILLVLDEFSSTITHLGGPKSQFARNVNELGWRGRKFGIILIFATQAITKDIIGHIRDQIALIICFRVAPSDTLAALSVTGADKITVDDNKHGRAITNRWGMVQTYLVDKDMLGASHKQTRLLTDRERTLYDAAQRNDGRITRALVSATLGIGNNPARAVQDGLARLGWIEKHPKDSNAYHVTPKWVQIATNPQPQQPPPGDTIQPPTLPTMPEAF